MTTGGLLHPLILAEMLFGCVDAPDPSHGGDSGTRSPGGGSFQGTPSRPDRRRASWGSSCGDGPTRPPGRIQE